MQRQMPVLPQPLAVNPLKDMSKVDEVNYAADFDNFTQKRMLLKSFSKAERYLTVC